MRARAALLFLAALVPCAACAREPSRPEGAPLPARSAAAAPAVDAGSPAAGRAPVVVTIVVDQMAGWIAAERWPKLPEAGGFARLRREGTWARDMRYEHAVTDTAPGHAALYTGEPPRVSGVFANEVLSRTRERVTILADPATHVVSADGARAGTISSSAARLRVDTIADRLRLAHPDAVVISLSLKDRGAIPGGGRRPTASVWMSSPPADFVTSSAFASSLPAWARRRGGAEAIAALRAWTWEPLDPPWLDAQAGAAGEGGTKADRGAGDYGGLGTRFPHDVARASAAAFRATPRADDALFGLALAAIDGEATALDRPVLLALSLSANDYIGHVFGPDAREAWDQLLRLDAALAGFLHDLDARFGESGYAVVLAADHGVVSTPEMQAAPHPWCAPGATAAPKRDASRDPWGRPCAPGRRIDPDALAGELRSAARDALGDADLVEGIADPYVILSPPARALPPDRRAALDRALRAALAKHHEIAAVIAVEKARAAPRDEIETLVHDSVADGGTGDYYIVPGRGSFFDTLYVPGRGTSHGTPYLYDRSVPLLVRAPGRVAAGAVVTDPISFRAFARAASELLAISPPDSARSAPSFLTRNP